MQDPRPDTMKLGGSFKSGHVVLGAVQKCCLLKQIAAAHADDPAFTQFQYNSVNLFKQTSLNSVMQT